jgi:hypothetical protein
MVRREELDGNKRDEGFDTAHGFGCNTLGHDVGVDDGRQKILETKG